MTKTEPVINQNDPELCSFILIKLAYNCQLILPIEEGFELLRIISKAQVFTDDHNKPKQILPMYLGKIGINFMTDLDINTIILEAGLQGDT
jgi:hypothetical protein